MNKRPFTVVQLVPTGIGAQIGGFAGDATPATNLLTQIADCVITHPNVVNASDLNEAREQVLYVEGKMLDDMMRGKTVLRPRRKNAIGILIDRNVVEPPQSSKDLGGKSELMRVLNAVNTVRAVNGIEVVGYKITDRPIDARALLSSTGTSHGNVEDLDTLFSAGKVLVDGGAEAIAVITRILDITPEMEEAYVKEGKADPIGGIEATISHFLVSELGVPAAHAPANATDLYSHVPVDEFVDPRVGAEVISHTYVPCIMQGLSRAPQPVTVSHQMNGDIAVTDVNAVLAPADALGGIPILCAIENGIPVIAIRENSTVLDVTREKIGFKTGVLEVNNYLEALGILGCLKAGINPAMVRRPLADIFEL